MDRQLLLSYLAGVIDADGCITIGRKVKNDKRCLRPSVYYEPKIILTEVNTIIPDLLHVTFGSRRSEWQPKNPKHKRWHIWASSGPASTTIIKELLPYLRLKRRQGEIAIELQELIERQWTTLKHVQHHIIPHEFNLERDELWKRMTALNQPTNRRRHVTDPAVELASMF